MIRSLRRWWRRIIYPPIRIPGTYPWNRPAHLTRGTPLIGGGRDFVIVADGKGGVMPMRRDQARAKPHQAR